MSTKPIVAICCRCRHEHLSRDRVLVPDRKHAGMEHAACPRCKAFTYKWKDFPPYRKDKVLEAGKQMAHAVDAMMKTGSLRDKISGDWLINDLIVAAVKELKTKKEEWDAALLAEENEEPIPCPHPPEYIRSGDHADQPQWCSNCGQTL